MPTLDIDMGNTRTKWRCGSQRGALAAPELPPVNVRPDRVRIATVRGNETEVAELVQARYGTVAEFASTSASLAGVRCAYRRPCQLGVDRWLAMVAAWQRTLSAVAVVGLGTAATVDIVDAEGHHQGGYIAPGLRLLNGSLERGTARVRAQVGAALTTDLGRDTASAVSAGTSLMLLAFVDAAVAAFRTRFGPAAAVCLTGGDASSVAPLLAANVTCVSDLVLDGLAIALP